MKRIVVILAVAATLMVPASALAQSPTCQAYSPQLCGASTDGTDAGTDGTDASTALPFTGLDVTLLVAGGGALLGAGLVVRRLSRQPN